MTTLNPYSHTPRFYAFLRLIPFSILAFVLGVWVMGVIALHYAAKERGTKLPIGISASRIVVEGASPLRAGALHTIQTLDYLFHVSEFCWDSKKIVNEFQKERCRHTWKFIGKKALIIAIPPLLALLCLALGMDQVSSFYRRSQKKVDHGQAAFSGNVLKHFAGVTLFSFIFCLRPVQLELKDHEQVRVYVPLSAPKPRPGQSYAVFEVGSYFGAKRRVAVFYAPHMAIVRGS
jgi:hypothetical protein